MQDRRVLIRAVIGVMYNSEHRSQSETEGEQGFRQAMIENRRRDPDYVGGCDRPAGSGKPCSYRTQIMPLLPCDQCLAKKAERCRFREPRTSLLFIDFSHSESA